jgi:uncharacterized membrane protein
MCKENESERRQAKKENPTFVAFLEAILPSLSTLMSQSRPADARSRLDLPINLLAEQESTKILQMLKSLCANHNVSAANDTEVGHLKAPTEPAKLLKEFTAGLPAEGR